LNKRTFLLTLVVLLSILSSNAAMLAWGQTEVLDFRYRASAMGECLIAYGGVGPGVPYPLKWVGTGDGHATASGYATDATETFPIIVPGGGVYISESITANGAVSARWTEQDGSRHSLIVRLYLTETSEALFYPSNNQFVLPIPMYSPPEKALRFKGIYQNDSRTEDISGGALFASGIYGAYPWPDRIIILLGVEQSETLFMLVWSRTNTLISFGPPNPPTFIALSAAKLYQTEVKSLQ